MTTNRDLVFAGMRLASKKTAYAIQRSMNSNFSYLQMK